MSFVGGMIRVLTASSIGDNIIIIGNSIGALLSGIIVMQILYYKPNNANK
jgi:hypothetical protein